MNHHNIHTQCKNHIITCLESRNIQVKIVDRFKYTPEYIDWADVVITAGGDGTFLMGASKINKPEKPIIGINSDPKRSVGYLCLPQKYSSKFDEALENLFSGNFQWQFRQRIRINLESETANEEPIELHNQQLLFPEYRFLDYDPQFGKSERAPKSVNTVKRELPVRSLNEVFIGESLSSRVSYYELTIEDSPTIKIRSSGLTICTGTGSTSWSFNINKVTPSCVQTIVNIIKNETGQELSLENNMIKKITDKFNQTFIFEPDRLIMAYTIRDPVVVNTNFNTRPRDFANKIKVRSRMFDACVVIDGGLSYKFNDGSVATFEIRDEDKLKTVMMNG